MTNRLGWPSKSRTPRHGHGLAAGQAVTQALAALRLWRIRRAAIRELDALPDAALRDIGLDRAFIPATVDALARRERPDNDAGPSRAPAQAAPSNAVGCC